jgi:hypothetical protein
MKLPVIATGDPISPTAHYTGYVWARNGLSPPELRTIEGRVLFESLRPVNTVNSLLGRGSLEQYLLARHRAIDLLLERAIDDHGIRQVIEIASGLSARGWRPWTGLMAALPATGWSSWTLSRSPDRPAWTPSPPSSIQIKAWSSSPRDCWATCPPMTSRPFGGAVP